MLRCCIYAKDVSILTGKSIRHAQRILKNLKFLLNKDKNQYITTSEFATYSGIDIETINKVCKFCFAGLICFF